MKANLPQIFEQATATAISETADIQRLPRIRCWRALEGDYSWATDSDRVIPQIGISARAPSASNNRTTFEVAVGIALMTDSADDQSHSDFVAYEEAIQGVLDAICGQHTRGTGGAELSAFEDEVDELFYGQDYTINIGGYTLGDGTDPVVEDGVNIMTWELIIHYSRSDI
jgi:hypothetical protein